MGASRQLEMCIVDADGVFQDTQQLVIKTKLGEGGFSRVIRVGMASSSSSSSSGKGTERAPSDMALKAAKVSDPDAFGLAMHKTLKEFAAATSATGYGVGCVLKPKAVGWLRCANGERWPCLLMDLAPHGCLLNVVCPRGVPKGMPPLAASHVMARMCYALMATHAGGYIHRDLKPHNILLFGTKESPTPKLADFGEAGELSNLHSTWTPCGTPGMRAPEMIEGTGQDSSTDVYVLGLLLLYIRWGLMPFWYLGVVLDDPEDVVISKLKRREDLWAELQHPECPYTKDPEQPGGPPKLAEAEMEFLGMTIGKLRRKTKDLVYKDYISRGLSAQVSYW